jgi:hypothetical protein
MKATRFVVFPVDIEDEVELSEMNLFFLLVVFGNIN